MTYQKKSKEKKLKEITQLTTAMEQQIQSYFANVENIKAYLNFMGKFHNYSVRNVALINSQFAGAEAVGSYKFWQSKGVAIRKGEKGIKVLVPRQYNYFYRKQKRVALSKASKREKELLIRKLLPTYKQTTFTIGHVFDISQTNANASDLPQIFPTRWLEGESKEYDKLLRMLKKLAKQSNIAIVAPHKELGTAKGINYVGLQEVALNPRNSTLQNVKTLTHELAHAVMHNKENTKHYAVHEKEFQAELVAYTVANYFGIDTTSYSLPYLHAWTSNKTMGDKAQLLNEVNHTAHDFITTIEQSYYNEREHANILLVRHYSGEKEYITNEKLYEIAGREVDIASFNQQYALDYSAIPITALQEPQVIIHHSKVNEVANNQILSYQEANALFEKLNIKYFRHTIPQEIDYRLVTPVNEDIQVSPVYQQDFRGEEFINLHHQVTNEHLLNEEAYHVVDDSITQDLVAKEDKEIQVWLGRI